MMTQIAVITNAGIITFTMMVLDDYGIAFRLWFFILFQWCCFAIQVVLSDSAELFGILICV